MWMNRYKSEKRKTCRKGDGCTENYLCLRNHYQPTCDMTRTLLLKHAIYGKSSLRIATYVMKWLILCRTFMNVVAYNILRPLHPESRFGGGTTSVRSLLIRHCAVDTELMEKYVECWPLKEYSPMANCAFYSTTLTLVSILYDPRAQDLFTRSCCLMRFTARDLPVARYIFQALKALAWSLKQTIPPLALQYFEHLGPGKDELKDIPAGYIMPQQDEIRELLSDDGKDSGRIAGELGTLLAKWSSLSVEWARSRINPSWL